MSPVTNFFLSSNGVRQLRVHCSGHMDDLSMYVDVQSFFVDQCHWTNRPFFFINPVHTGAFFMVSQGFFQTRYHVFDKVE